LTAGCFRVLGAAVEAAIETDAAFVVSATVVDVDGCELCSVGGDPVVTSEVDFTSVELTSDVDFTSDVNFTSAVDVASDVDFT
jgi:hypothetical protein